jgi:hypothetical protein
MIAGELARRSNVDPTIEHRAVNRNDEMRAYDALPADLRLILRTAPICYSTTQVMDWLLAADPAHHCHLAPFLRATMKGVYREADARIAKALGES